MKVKELIKLLKKYDPEALVLYFDTKASQYAGSQCPKEIIWETVDGIADLQKHLIKIDPGVS